jgi:hypothetical protein
VSYRDKFRREVPPCFGEEYDEGDPECRKECPVRKDCYREVCDKLSLREARKSGLSGSSSRTKKWERDKRHPASTEIQLRDPEDVLPYEGEPWYSRLFWNSVSGGLSAVGAETHVFFRAFRFPPKPKALPASGCGGCGGGCGAARTIEVEPPKTD